MMFKYVPAVMFSTWQGTINQHWAVRHNQLALGCEIRVEALSH